MRHHLRRGGLLELGGAGEAPDPDTALDRSRSLRTRSAAGPQCSEACRPSQTRSRDLPGVGQFEADRAARQSEAPRHGDRSKSNDRFLTKLGERTAVPARSAEPRAALPLPSITEVAEALVN